MKLRWIAGLLLIALAAAGCGGNDQDQAVQEENLEPVTLKMFLTQRFNAEEMQQMLVGPLQEQYPHITLEEYDSTNIEQLLAGGEMPDLITIWNGPLLSYERLGLLADVTPYLERNQVDLTRFESHYLDAIKINNEDLYGLPYTVQFNALYYNKELFDRFGADYPRDGMTWDDAIQLARTLTREEGGVQYRGLDYESLIRISFPLSVGFVDHETQQPVVNTDAWRTAFQTAGQILSIPGNRQPQLNSGSYAAFFNEQVVAMFATINQFRNIKPHIDEGFQVGAAQYPSYAHRPDTYGLVDAHYMLISSQSPNKDAAAKVLKVLTSDAVQTIATSRFARLSPLQSAEVKAAFGTDMPHLEGIDFASVFKSKPAPAPIFPLIYGQAYSIMNAAFARYVNNEQDLNTTLRMAEEQVIQLLEQEASK